MKPARMTEREVVEAIVENANALARVVYRYLRDEATRVELQAAFKTFRDSHLPKDSPYRRQR